MNSTLRYLYSLERFGMKLGLERMQDLVQVLGNPQQVFPAIHVTGTNGKGSTCALLAFILQEAGYVVGLYTSPHLIRFNERIRVNGVSISDRDISRLTREIRLNIKGRNMTPTFFEFTTALAFLYFAQKKVDIAVIEVGMGGRLDATNVITPLLSVITSIDFDHLKSLGTTKRHIAGEKAGIIKSGIPLVTGERDEKILAYFRQRCSGQKSRMYVVKKLLSIRSLKSSLAGQVFTSRGAVTGKFQLGLLGKHQLQNAGVVLVVVHRLRQQGWVISDLALRRGLRNARWAGRLDLVSRKSLILVDGAHNVQGAEAVHDFMGTIPRREVLMIGIAKDKDFKTMISLLAPLFPCIVVTQGNFKPQKIEVLAREARRYSSSVHEIKNVKKALAFSRKKLSSQGCLLITGSLYMIGDVLKEFADEGIGKIQK